MTPFPRWKEWIKIIGDDVSNILLARTLFLSFQELVDETPKLKKADYFHDYFRESYISHLGIGLRRQFKFQKDSICLKNLLCEIREQSHLINLGYYESLYSDSKMKKYAADDFYSIIGSTDKTISSEAVDVDIALLNSSAFTVESFIDRRVAHIDRRPPSRTPTYNDLHDCLDVVENLTIKYHMLLTAGSYETLEPVVQYGFLDIFRDELSET